MRAATMIAAAGLLFAPHPAAAHRGHGALSVVEIDARTGGIKVSHRIPAHDAEPALARIAPDAQASLDDPEAIEAFKAYMLETFTLAVDGAAVDLKLQGMTLGADEVRLEYAGKVAIDDVGAPVTVKAAMFADVYGDEVNQVNIRRNGITRTLIFSGEDAHATQLAPDSP
ncbi:DUF6702 family protein [Caulobacter segnis]